ncbi:hypothetical protein OUZ56_006714 [Daphnia magna]|uniref:Uncharacterized protein n=1 Tax=Daphnia magna TaxID=35525 RepID=A0ABQ9YWH3_9CRUS|nr:hypothetical protein OUZ56_006714 [Daphnia magna]
MVGNSGSENTSTKTITSIQATTRKKIHSPINQSINNSTTPCLGHAQGNKKCFRTIGERKIPQESFAGTRDESPYGRQPQRRINPAHKVLTNFTSSSYPV